LRQGGPLRQIATVADSKQFKQFMKSSLSGQSDGKPATTTQQDKMKSCNEEAGKKNLNGDDRKKFMSTCLSD
jgi:hypothetical protein